MSQIAISESAAENIFVSREKAQEIMEDKFLDPEAVFQEIINRHNGFSGPKPGDDEFKIIPISERELREYQEHFLLVPGYELCLEDFYSMAVYDLGFELEDAWFLGFPFANWERVERCWYLVRKNVIPDSIGETYFQMQERLKPGEEIPRVCELIFAVFFYCIFSGGIHLYRGQYPICRDIIWQDFRPHVGFFGKELGVRYFSKNTPDPRIGLVPIRKLIVP